MKKLLCLQEHRIEDLQTGRLEKYEDEFGYVYEIPDDKALEFLVLVEDGKPKFREVSE